MWQRRYRSISRGSLVASTRPPSCLLAMVSARSAAGGPQVPWWSAGWARMGRAFALASCAARNGTSCASNAFFATRRRGIGYQEIEGGPGTIKAETCDKCHGWVKILQQHKELRDRTHRRRCRKPWPRSSDAGRRLSPWRESIHSWLAIEAAMKDAAARLRDIPSVDQVLKTSHGVAASELFGCPRATGAVRTVLADARASVRGGEPPPSAEAAGAAALERLKSGARSALRPVFNLTGTVLHTNLGRAVLAEAAVAAAAGAMYHAMALEFDLATGKRGKPVSHLRGILCELTGAEDATIVNNNAAAVLIVLNSLAAGKEAVVSRGELMESGGAFRMPDIMARAGAWLKEVGTTNRTHAKDYVAAIGPETGLILKVHPSNYRIEGFTASVSPRDLAGIAQSANIPMVHDLGSGTLVDLCRFGLPHEPTVREAVAEGAGLVTFSGDKLLGGPQAGFIVGRKESDRGDQQEPDEASIARGQDPARRLGGDFSSSIVIRTVLPSSCQR